MPNQKENQTELAAALFHTIGGAVPHPYELEGRARQLTQELGDQTHVLLKIVELCSPPAAPAQLYLSTKAYSWLGGTYSSQAAKCAAAYLATDGWTDLPRKTVGEDGIPVNGAAASRASVVADLAAAEQALGKAEASLSHYLEAYRLEPYRAMFAIKAADSMVSLGRREEALTFLRGQRQNRYYTPVKYKDAQGNVARNDTFRELLNAHILKLEAAVS